MLIRSSTPGSKTRSHSWDIIANSTFTLDPAKTELIEHIAVPTNTRELQRFLGLCGYYRRFLPDYAQMMSPLSELLKSSNSWHWGAHQARVFARDKLLL
ncbi:unnamed protein product [Phytophthora fragariaefolia]|uniref:Unnamed protein product n=1 Tax=Phytophthora fragariaefolia TaxID=1490495 RepID=A0A9W6YME6_9STRA|nr:unnamed protein product [Phytophthora fragariaefolia]